MSIHSQATRLLISVAVFFILLFVVVPHLMSRSPEAFRELIADLAARFRVPAIYPYREFVEVGGLLSYGFDVADIMRRVAQVTAQVLGGAKPSDIPFYRQTKYELVLNQKAATLLGLEFPATLLTAVGFGMFAAGLGLNAFETPDTDFNEMFWPQLIRGAAIMFCLLPPTRLALGGLSQSQVPDASGLFNMMRNLGGVIGIALIDTILYGRTSIHADALRARLIAGDATAAHAIRLDPDLFATHQNAPIDAAAEAYLRPMIEKAAFAASANEAWLLLACFALLGALLVPFEWKHKSAKT